MLWLIPDAPPLAALLLTSVSVGVFGALLEGAYHQESGRLAMGDGVLAVAAIMALQAADQRQGGGSGALPCGRDSWSAWA